MNVVKMPKRRNKTVKTEPRIENPKEYWERVIYARQNALVKGEIQHLSIRQFSELTGVPETTLRSIENDKQPSSKQNKQLAKAGFNVGWLVSGEGPMRPQSAPTQSEPAATDQAGGEVVLDVFEPMDVLISGAGPGKENHEPYRQMMVSVDWALRTFHLRPRQLKLVLVNGDSMSPTVQRGQMVVVNPAIRSFTGNGIYLLNDRYEGEVIRRLLAYSDGRIRVKADNPADDLPDHVYTPDRLEALTIAGRVLGEFRWSPP